MSLSRRGFLAGIIAAGVAPAILRPGLIMPIKSSLIIEPSPFDEIAMMTVNDKIKAFAKIAGVIVNLDPTKLIIPARLRPGAHKVIAMTGDNAARAGIKYSGMLLPRFSSERDVEPNDHHPSMVVHDDPRPRADAFQGGRIVQPCATMAMGLTTDPEYGFYEDEIVYAGMEEV